MTNKLKGSSESCDYGAICPYCGHENHVEAEDFSESEREDYCESCEMKFLIYQSFSVTNNTIPDCKLNGEDHSFKGRDGREICINCGRLKS